MQHLMQVEAPFTNHRIQIVKGDQLYLFSDGFFDQMGGEIGRRFMSKNFKQLLLSNSQKSMSEQRQILNKSITDWMGAKYKQLDDILVLGVKV
jgi:serine phosphatase RsbU (regulator of sigma subunit)